MQKIPQPGDRYRHFKGNIYRIIVVAEDTETGDSLVIYRSEKHPEKVWARPMDQFLEALDPGKYPHPGQEYRFQPLEESQAEKEPEEAPAGAAVAERPAAEAGPEAEPEGPAAQEAGPEAQEAPKAPAESRMNPLLDEFLEAKTAEERLDVLRRAEGVVGQREISSMYMALDLPPVRGSLPVQLDGLRKYILLQEKFDAPRMRQERYQG